MERPQHVQEAIWQDDKEKIRRFASAGGKEAAKRNQEKAAEKSALKDIAEIKKEESALEEKIETLAVQNMHRTNAEGDVLPPEDTDVWH